MLSFLLSQAYTDVSEAVVVKPWGLTMVPGGGPKCVSKHLGKFHLVKFELMYDVTEVLFKNHNCFSLGLDGVFFRAL